jgi:hypothetical protein
MSSTSQSTGQSPGQPTAEGQREGDLAVDRPAVATEREVALGDVVARSPWGRFQRVFGLEAADVGVASEQELLRRLADAEGLMSQLMAAQGRDLRELRERRLTAQREENPPGHDPGSCTRGCCDEDGWVALEVAQALVVTERQVGHRLDTALRLERFTSLGAAVQQGRVQSWTATKLAELLDELGGLVSAQRLEHVERVVVAWLLDRPRTVGQVTARMRRWITAARAQSDDGLQERGARDRRVWVEPAGRDGLATLVARLPEADALAVRAVLAALAQDPTAAIDTRTREQRQADLMTSLITGFPAAHGQQEDCDLLVRGAGSLVVRMDVTVPADSLRGGSAPAEVPGYGPIPAATARTMAGSVTECRGLVYHPETGHLLGLSDLLPAGRRSTGTGAGTRMRWLEGLPAGSGYAHPPVMERLVQRRDVTCRAPGCTRRAAACDCDHVVPYPRGQTSAENTCCLCRRHHRLKTHAPGWAATVDDDGGLTWTTPTGTTLTTDPHDYRPDPDPPPF